MFQKSEEELKKLGAEITVREIKQQPSLWLETFKYYQDEIERIENFFDRLKEKHEHMRVILSGAGSSAYVGETVLPYLREAGDQLRYDFQAVPTTHIVSNPRSYFTKKVPTILVSFARSGNSPESLASVELGQQLVDDFYQITITCAADGTLAQRSQGDENNLLLLMPERANDQGFAMTGSFTCMALTAMLLLEQVTMEEKAQHISRIVKMAKDVLDREEEIQAMIDRDFNRVIYLGSGPLAGIAREVQLKILELTAGKVATAFDSSLGFRHGPKSFVDEKSLLFLFVSNDDYTRQYDLDMLAELNADKIANTVCSIEVEQEKSFGGEKFAFSKRYQTLPDAYIALPFTIFGQMVSVLTAVKVANKPDTPSPTGTVNRVVKGVTIHNLEETKGG